MASIPNDETGQALRRIEEDGSDLSKPMEIDFFVAVPSQEQGLRIAAEIKKEGFRVSVEQDDLSLNWTCYCTKKLVPEHSEISNIEKLLTNIASPYGGYADGFGSYGNK